MPRALTPETVQLHESRPRGQVLGSGPDSFHSQITWSPLQGPSWPQFLYLLSVALGRP